jgi:hypothetical protein
MEMSDNRVVTVYVWYEGSIINSYDVSGRTTGDSIIAVKKIIEEEADPNMPIDQISYSYEEKV